jgi:hypothetical protein
MRHTGLCFTLLLGILLKSVLANTQNTTGIQPQQLVLQNALGSTLASSRSALVASPTSEIYAYGGWNRGEYLSTLSKITVQSA